MRYIVLVVGVLALIGVLAALILLPTPTAGPVPTPRPSAAVDASGRPIPDASAGPTTAPPNAETGAETDGDGFTPMESEEATPEASVEPSASVDPDFVACDLFSVQEMARTSDLEVVAAAAPVAAPDPESAGDLINSTCEYRDSEEQPLVILAAAAPVDDIDADLEARAAGASESGMTFTRSVDSDDEDIAAAYSVCSACSRQTYLTGVIYTDDVLLTVIINHAPARGADEAFAAIAEAILD